MDSDSHRHRVGHNFLGTGTLDWTILNNLVLTGKVGYTYNSSETRGYEAIYKYIDYSTTTNKLGVTWADNTLLTLQALLNYNLEIGDNKFHLLGGFSQEAFRDNSIYAYRDNFATDLLYEINSGSSANQQNTGTASEWAIRSFFGRLNYSLKDRYLLEANLRYDGTSRFAEANRWALFPSVSMGWRLSEESFMKDNIDWIDNLKLRASFGVLGNQNIGTYPYQDAISFGGNYTFGGALSPGAYVGTLANKDIKWEKTRVIDVGLDLNMLDNNLEFVFDYFNKYTSDILYNVTASSVLGLTSSAVNAGEVKNTGFEAALNYHVSIGDLHMNFIPNFSYIHNEVVSISGDLKRDIDNGFFVGEPLQSIYGYRVDGLFVDSADIASYATQPYVAIPGMPRYMDIGGPDPNGEPGGLRMVRLMQHMTGKYLVQDFPNLGTVSLL